MSDEAIPPRKQSPTITSILFSPTSLHMGLPIRLHSILLRTPLTLPLLLPMLSTKVLLYPSQIPKSPFRVVVHASRLGTHVDPFPNLGPRSLPELPRQVVAAAVELEVLVSLEPFAADLAYESVCC